MAPSESERPNSAREKPDTEAVVVGIRVRPLLPKDIAEGSRECVRKVPDEPQLVLGVDRAFTFDHVFESTASQDALYADCMKPLVQSVLKGMNATVLAYGQTGSGKTHTMGSSATSAEAARAGASSETATFGSTVGLIPRALQELFGSVAASAATKCTAKASFIEIYKEEVCGRATAAQHLALNSIKRPCLRSHAPYNPSSRSRIFSHGPPRATS